jgi:hypothetical protein
VASWQQSQRIRNNYRLTAQRELGPDFLLSCCGLSITAEKKAVSMHFAGSLVLDLLRAIVAKPEGTGSRACGQHAD